MRTRLIATGLIGLLFASLALGATVYLTNRHTTQHTVLKAPTVFSSIHQDVSRPLSSFSPLKPVSQGDHEGRNRTRFIPVGKAAQPRQDGAIQGSATQPLVGTTPGLGFAGIGQGDYGTTVNVAPPDTNGAVGATQYVQWVNLSFAVFNKSNGALLYGPATGNTLWTGFGGGCEANNDGDPIVKYDRIANRWVMTQFSVTTLPYLQCVAVSTTSDATGTWNRYSFPYNDFNDYPKMGVWPDGYYISFNMFAGGTTFIGSQSCAFDRAKMLTGAPATQVCFQLSSLYGGLLPSDMDGTLQPTAGEPNFFVAYDVNALFLWKFHVDFTTPANSTFAGPTSIPVAAFSAACSGGGTCIPQAGTTNQLDSLADRLMYRLQYRKFADGHESLVVNHAVTAGSSVGERWYEIRSPNGTPTVYQQSTYAPDSSYRWMGSVAMDQQGNMAMGYSVSSSTLKPSIRYTGRLVTDPLSTMQAETSLKVGAGAETGGLTRWGDYSDMELDPVDDCTFWYTTEYLKVDGTFNWSTWISSFKFPGCGTPPTPDFSVSASPSSLSFVTGGTGSFTVAVAPTGGFNGTVTLTPSSTPAGLTVTPASATSAAPGYPSATFTVSGSTAGTYTVTVTGRSGTLTHTTTVQVTVTAPAAPDFTMTANPTTVTSSPSIAGTSTISLAALNGWNTAVGLTVSAPAGITATISPTSVAVPGSATLTLNGATPGTYTVTVTGSGTSGGTARTHTVKVTFTITNDNCNNC